MTEVRPSEQMRTLAMVQHGAPTLTEHAPPFDLPAERDTAELAVDSLFASMERIAQVHPFAKGMRTAAPQIGIGLAAAIVQPPAEGAGAIVLLNPRVTDVSDDMHEQYKGCLSFFDVRGMPGRRHHARQRTPGRRPANGPGRPRPPAESAPAPRSAHPRRPHPP